MHFCSSPKVPILLVGCKTDLRSTNSGQEGSATVSSKQGYAAAAVIGAFKYMECSSTTGEGVRDIALAAVEIATSWYPRPRYLREPRCIVV
jgi:GTPase SAR1 family protein